MNITLISTIHEESGLCTVSGLYKILLNLKPDVIFLEIPPSHYNQYLIERTRNNLETAAVKQYLEEYRVECIPVDIHNVSEEFFKNNQKLHNRVERNSFEYRRLMDLNSQYQEQYGYKYLNSTDCMDIWANIRKTIRESIDRLNDIEIQLIHQSWNDAIENRDQEMIKNIYKYSEEHSFTSGVFLVGVAHRQSLMEKAHIASVVDSKIINWNYENYENIL